ncbi:MAG TPA: AAA family ATPase, partial [Gaiellaceae bacterium]|nr:AAA family ATPase [Gaiellaceae bacterium]
MSRLFRSAFIPLLAIVLVVWLASNTLMSKPRHASADITTYSQLWGAVQNGTTKFEEIVFNPSKRSITATEADGKTTVSVHYPTDQSATQFETLLRGKEIKFDSKGTGGFSWTALIGSFLPFLLLIGFWIFLMNQVQGGGSKVMSFGKSRAKRMAPDSPKIGFKDVAGVDEAVEELQEIKEFLENPKKFQALGARIPKGVLLYGPPGTGKTLLARAVAGEAGVPFFSISGSDFVEMFVGVGASRVRDLFEQAKQASPCIVF